MDKPNLLKRLIDYGNSDFYPFHMPGHKRQWKSKFGEGIPNPFLIDITEIDGFDNLHHPEGILKDSMKWAADVYGSDKSYYLVNGSSCGILSAIGGTVTNGGTILMSRNCHKSAFHGVFLNRLKTEYVYPQLVPDFGVQGGLSAKKIQALLKNHPDIQAVFIVSPTYDGVVSDIKAIAEVVHKFQKPLIVDEAHGAHFPFGKASGFPVSALELGADLVIQSLHKTLPSFTQTAIVHGKRGFVDLAKLERYLQMYQTSSPSYIMMAGIENCIRYMVEEGQREMKDFSKRLHEARCRLQKMKCLRILGEEIKGKQDVFDLDISKIIISTRGTGMSGNELGERLRNHYHLEMEMCGFDYVTAITTFADTDEGLSRLCNGLLEIDEELYEMNGIEDGKQTVMCGEHLKSYEGMDLVMRLNKKPESRFSMYEAMDAPRHRVNIRKAQGKVSAEFIYVYPPGIPIVTPGEVMDKGIIELIEAYKRQGLSVQGLEDEDSEEVFVLSDER